VKDYVYYVPYVENELLESIENNEWKSKDEELAKRTKELQRYIKNQKKELWKMQYPIKILYKC